MLEIDFRQEHVDVEHYKKLAEGADKLGLIALRIHLEEQAADEQNHAIAMRRMLG
jgi:rubrerythrin